MPDGPPNVLLVHCHDLGRYLGCYGVDIETPNIDGLASSGVLFEKHFVTAPQCSPSRGSLMTGRYPHVNGLMGLAHGSWELHHDERILPQYLRESGYETHLFGLQHITQNTDRLGYDHVHSEGNLYPGVSPGVHTANRARNVASVLSTFFERKAFESPFFASVGFFELHRLEEDDGRFGFDPDYYEMADPDAVRPLPYLPDRRGIRRDLAEMHGMVSALDDAMGTILESLEASGLADRTLVIFTTEHGIAFPRAKGSPYDAGIEATLIMRYPGIADGGERYDELLSNVDVLPTILDFVETETEEDRLDHPERGHEEELNSDGENERTGEVGSEDKTVGRNTIQGRSFLPLLIDDEYEARDRIFTEMTWHDMYNPFRAIRTSQYKYVKNFWHLPKVYLTKDIFASEAGRAVRESDGVPPRPYEELYDLEAAPQEDENVVREPAYQDVREKLSADLYEWMVDTNDPLLDGPVPPGDMDEIMSWPHE